MESSLGRTKVLTVGDSLTGKSCIVKRFCEKKFYTKYKPTIGIDYGVKTFTFDKHTLKVDFWDVSGHPEFADIRQEFFENTQICLLVYDVSSQESFENIERVWLNELNPFVSQTNSKNKDELYSNTKLYLIANKIDTTERKVSTQTGKLFAKLSKSEYFETSSKTGIGIDDLFQSIFSYLTSFRK